MVLPIVPTLEVEMDFGNAILDAEGNAILDANDAALLDADWALVEQDMRAKSPIRIKKGNFGSTQKDRVGDVGTMDFALDNSENNSSELLGMFSPSNANARSGFGEETKIRLKLSYGASSKYKFQGLRFDKIDPDSGKYMSARLTFVTAVDWFDEAASTLAKGLDVELLQRDDQLLDLLLAVMENPPESTNFSVGPDQYAVAFHDVMSESTKIMGVLQSLMMSGIGTVFLNGTATTGEELTYRSRNAILSLTTPVATLDNSMVSLEAPRIGKSRVRKVLGISHPARVDAAATSKIFELTQEIEIAAGETITFTGRYIDPDQQAQRIAAIDFVALVADTHYKFSSTSGSGNDLNADLVIVDTNNADAVDYQFTNNSGVIGYLWFLELFAKGVFIYNTIEHVAEDTSVPKGQEMTFDMIYQDQFNTAKNITESLLAWESVEENERAVVHFKANRNATLMAAAIDVEPGDLVSIAEDVIGLDRLFFANGVELEIGHGGRNVDVWWTCVPARQGQLFCILNLVGSAELNTTAILSF
ncbi:MAG: hypothetical protein HN916_18185 [Anaerolineae bacterium]|jgi:hypothetical protein|nr:hypothetical protein [Anaerolineae bacterium]